MHRAWDRRLARRAAGIAAVAAVATLLIVATTDDGAPWPRRLAMWAALAPVAGALGARGAIRLAETRGELRALAAIGSAPWRVVAGAVCGGSIVALLGPCLAASGFVDLEALFPRPHLARIWVAEGDRAMRELTIGVRVAAGGALEVTAPGAAGPGGALPRGAHTAAVTALGLGAIVGPAWAAREAPISRRVIVGGVIVVALIVAFQAVASGRASAAVLLVPPLVPLIELGVAWYRRPRDISDSSALNGRISP